MSNISNIVRHAVSIFLFTGAFLCQGQQPISLTGSGYVSASGGNGDSLGAVSTPDGRYVAFASTADNLASLNGSAMQQNLPASFNVFLRDRQAGTTRLVSVNTSGTAGGEGHFIYTNGINTYVYSATANSLPAGISADGRYVLFTSSVAELTQNDANYVQDIFVRDMLGNTTFLVSANRSGRPANAVSTSPCISTNGRYVAFVSSATDLVEDFTNKTTGVFIRDLQFGTTVLASRASDGTIANTNSDSPAMTPDGRYVVFCSSATNLATGVFGFTNVFLRDTVLGATYWVSASGRYSLDPTAQMNAVCVSPIISDDGREIVYGMQATNHTVGSIVRYNVAADSTDFICTNAVLTLDVSSDEYGNSFDLSRDGKRVLFVQSNSACAPMIGLWTESASVTWLCRNTTNGLCNGTSVARPTFDSSGQRVAFLSDATDLTANLITGGPHLFVRDTVQGATFLADANTNGANSSLGWKASFSFSSNAIFFDSTDGSLVPNDSNKAVDVFAVNLLGGTAELISAHAKGLQSSTPFAESLWLNAAVSANGRYVVFVSDADNLALNDRNSARDVFVKDRQTGETTLVSVATNGMSASGSSSEPSISGDGRYVAFTSSARDIAAFATNTNRQVFVRDLQSGVTMLASQTTNGLPANGDCAAPLISEDGRWLLFWSPAKNLNRYSYTVNQAYLRDLSNSTTTALTTSSIASVSGMGRITPDGHYVAYQSPSYVQIWDTTAGRNTYSNYITLSDFAISTNGKYLAMFKGTSTTTGNSLVIVDTSANTTQTVSSTSLAFSMNRDATSIASLEGGASQKVVLYALNSGIKTSLATNTFLGAMYIRRPVISPNGQMVTYTSFTPSDLGLALQDLILYNASPSNQVVMASQRGSSVPIPFNPAFSRDGSSICFQSVSALGGGDYNGNVDVYAYDILALAFQTNLYRPAQSAVVCLTEPAFNVSATAIDTVQIQVCSDLDSIGIPLTLTESQTNSGYFTGTLSFATNQSSASERKICAADGSRVWASVTVPASGQSLIATALVINGNLPIITAQPVSTNICVGSAAALQVRAFSTEPLRYQWYCNNSVLSFATNSALVLSKIDYGQAGAYTVVVSNAVGGVTSAVATVIVGVAPYITSQPQPQRARVGSTAVFSVGVDGDYPLGVKWWPTLTNFDSTLIVSNVQPSQTGVYYAVVTNAFGSVTTDPVHLWLTGAQPVLTTKSLSNSKLVTSLVGQVGVSYVVLQSSNLINWRTNTSIKLSSTNGLILQLPAGQAQMFYQVREE